MDPSGASFSVNETTTDIKIYLKSSTGEIFSKGDGIELLVQHAKLDMTNGSILVCGDSLTDLPMLEVCLKNNPTGVYTVWVTTDTKLQDTVSNFK